MRLVALVLLSLAWALPARAQEAPFPADPRAVMDEAKFVDANGHVLTLDKLRGHVVLVSFWGSWCVPCIRELPSIVQMARTLEAEGHKLEVVLVSGNSNWFDRDNAYLKEQRVPWRNYRWTDRPFPEREVFFGVRDPKQGVYYPNSLVLDRDGIAVKWFRGSTDWGPVAADLRPFFAEGRAASN